MTPCTRCGSPEQRRWLSVGCPGVPPASTGKGREMASADAGRWQSVSMITERSVAGRPPGDPGDAAPGTRRDPLTLLRAYLALCKPQIVELLLVTTVPTMMVAAGGWPDLRTLAVVLIGGAMGGRRRERTQLLHRPRHRPGHAAHQAAPAAGQHGDAAIGAHLRTDHGRDLGRAHGGVHQLAGHGDDGRGRSSTTTSSTRSGSSAAPRPTPSGAASAVRPPWSSAGPP